MSSKRSKWIGGIFVVGIFSVFAISKWMYQDHETTAERDVALVSTVDEFSAKVEANQTELENQIVEVTGKVSQVDVDGFMLEGTIYGKMEDPAQISQITEGQELTIRGRYIGYDELLEEIKLDKCILLD